MARQTIPLAGLWSAIAGLFNANFTDIYTAQRFGIYDYNDLETATTPILMPLADTWYGLTNDGAGPYTNKNYSLAGVPDLWDAGTDRFDFTDLELGDTVEIRLDVNVTSNSLNQTFDVDLVLAEGTAAEYRIPFIVEQAFKAAGSREIIRFSGIYMGDTDTLNNPAKFQIRSSSQGSVKVNGWYIKAGRMRFEQP